MTNVQEWTMVQCRDWLAEQDGWKRHGRGWWKKNGGYGGRNYEDHPHEPTLDGAAKALPSGWTLEMNEHELTAWPKAKNKNCVQLPATDNETLDRYRLAVLTRMTEERPT